MEVWWQDLIEANQNHFHYEDTNEETNSGLLVYFCVESPKMAILAASTQFKGQNLIFLFHFLALNRRQI